MVENDGDGEVKSLIAAINLKDESYSYMIKKPISVYFKANCQTDLDITVDFEAYKDGELSNNFHVSSLKVESGYWMPVTFPANMPDADSLLVYVRFSGINKVWVDDINIDVTK